ncbi:MAG: hypothetical protein ACK4RZ_02120 [Paracoccaceae bacterium]
MKMFDAKSRPIVVTGTEKDMTVTYILLGMTRCGIALAICKKKADFPLDSFQFCTLLFDNNQRYANIPKSAFLRGVPHLWCRNLRGEALP